MIQEFNIRRRRLTTLGAIAVGLCLLALPAAAEEEAPSSDAHAVSREYKIKAAFLYQFSRYVEWPAGAFGDSETPFVIGVYGADPFGDVSKKISSEKKVGSRQIEFRTLTSAAGAEGCHILFVPRGVTNEALIRLLEATKDHPVLVVSDASGFVDLGGDVQFFIQDNKVRFAFSDDVGKRSLRVSSKLLSLSKPAPPAADGLY